MTTPADISGLVSWYLATAAYCFSDAAGTTPCNDGDLVYVWKDRQGTNHLQQSNASLRPTYRNSGGYTYVDFDGSRYMDFGAGLATATPLSMALWDYPTAANTTPLDIGASGSANNHFRLASSSASGIQATSVNNAGSAAVAQTGAGAIQSLNAWSHIVGTFASSTSRAAYLNGGNKGTSALSNTPTAGSINLTRVGGRTNATSLFTGRIAEVAVWNVAIADADVASLYASGVPTQSASGGGGVLSGGVLASKIVQPLILGGLPS